MSYLSAFNQQLVNFIEELHNLFPKDNEISLALNTVYLLKKTNPKKIIEFFRDYFMPYEDKIKKMDVSFFIKKDYDNEVSDYVKSLNVITNLKKYWDIMSQQSKKNIWIYMNVLVKLCHKYYGN